jgi:putative transposase
VPGYVPERKRVPQGRHPRHHVPTHLQREFGALRV